jgi:hypothetical protein
VIGRVRHLADGAGRPPLIIIDKDRGHMFMVIENIDKSVSDRWTVTVVAVRS